MKAVLIHQYGDLEEVVVEDLTTPTPGPQEVLVRLAAASVNPLDGKLISGKMQAYFPLALPYSVGTDLSGTVVETGSEVSGWKPGDRVFGRLEPGPGEGPEFSRGGAFAEYVAVPAKHLAHAPASLELAHAAGLPTAAGTAWQALFQVAGLKGGQTILVHAGAGGVGSSAVQLAKHIGARVIATASSGNVELVRGLGADEIIDYRAENFAERVKDADVVLDTVGGELLDRSYQVLRPGGILVTIAAPPSEEQATKHQVQAKWMGHASDALRLEKIAALCESGELRVVIDSIHPLTEAKAALTHSATGRAKGKILLTPEN